MSDDHIGVKVNGVLYVRLEDVRRLREGWDKADEHIEAQAAELTRLRALVAETGALAARRAAMLEASEERERAIELRFWQIVDRDGLTGMPSDMWAALDQLVKDRAELGAHMEVTVKFIDAPDGVEGKKDE